MEWGKKSLHICSTKEHSIVGIFYWKEETIVNFSKGTSVYDTSYYFLNYRETPSSCNFEMQGTIINYKKTESSPINVASKTQTYRCIHVSRLTFPNPTTLLLHVPLLALQSQSAEENIREGIKFDKHRSLTPLQASWKLWIALGGDCHFWQKILAL